MSFFKGYEKRHRRKNKRNNREKHQSQIVYSSLEPSGPTSPASAPVRRYSYQKHDRSRLSFFSDMNMGLSSRAFDLTVHNLDDNETRMGLDESSKEGILEIMKNRKDLSFDDARLLYIMRKMYENGIAPDGTPMDPRAVCFST